MDLKELAEPFAADDIEWRVQSSGLSGGKPWARVLAYVTARAIMSRLDEVCGPEDWKVSYTHEGAGVMCRLSIRVERDPGWEAYWVEKCDGAAETQVEAFKGGISSALKRAGAVWGIGRYLYKLDAGFAECDLNTKKFPNYGKTKEGTVFSWKPPGLPDWALPGEDEPPAKRAKKASKKSALASDPFDKPSKAEPTSDAAVLLTAAQNKQIHALKRDIGVSDAAYHQIILKDYTAEKTSDLLKWQASEVIDRLKQRLKGKLDHEAKDTFGDDGGRVKSLRRMAHGHCAKIRTGGECYQNKEPIDYLKEGLGARSLKELEEFVDAMTDEKELEKMIVRLEALLATVTF